MSSTYRSRARDIHIADYYVTPVNKIENFLREFKNYENTKNLKVLDCCAGGDETHNMSYPIAFKNILNTKIDTIDIRHDSLAELRTDYLTYQMAKRKYDWIITSPCFGNAKEIIEKALSDVKSKGFVIMLLRLNFLEGKKRKEFFEKHMPKYIFVHSTRMSFTDNKKVDSIAYAYFVWQKGFNPEFSQIKII